MHLPTSFCLSAPARASRSLPENYVGEEVAAEYDAARDVAVDGMDPSEAMAERLRSKPGGDRIPVTIGDFATMTRTSPTSSTRAAAS